MAVLIQEHCYHHPGREAVARCPVCGHFFCRECVTEHDDRMLCSRCLAQTTAAGPKGSGRWMAALMVPLQLISGFLIVWLVFYLMGQMLLAIPNAFHEGSIWQADWWRHP